MLTDKPIPYVIGTPDVVRMTLPSRLNLLGIVENTARILCERSGFDDTAIIQVTMAVVEAATNAVQHGHARDATKLFDVIFEAWPERLEIRVHDSGAGFDLSEVDVAITSAEQRFLSSRGRGMFIMLSSMDSVEYKFGSSGTTCHLVKHRRAAAAANG